MLDNPPVILGYCRKLKMQVVTFREQFVVEPQ